MNLQKIINNIKSELDKKDKRREKIFANSREIRRFSTKAIREIHKENFDDAKDLIDAAAKIVSTLNDSDFEFNFLQESLQEYSEAVLVYAFLKDCPIPTPKELSISPESYVLGLADSVGELRRCILDSIRKDDFDKAEYFLDLMDEISFNIMAFDYPSAVLPIRRKQDVIRVLLEKTRGDVTLALKLTTASRKFEENLR